MAPAVPAEDPYDVLGVAFTASNAEIAKAYRKVALQLHPDKQQGKNAAEQDAAARKFHALKEARSFLLDAEHAEERRKYDAKRESQRLRQQTEAHREKTMSKRRKKMRDELKQKEAVAAAQGGTGGATGGDTTTTSSSGNKSKRKRQSRDTEEEVLDALRKEGKRKREEYAAERDAQEVANEMKLATERAAIRNTQRQQQKESLEERQIRLKWDRKRILKTNHGVSPSEDSLAQHLSEFGTVEHVEMLGKKGNQALVTFADASSCRPCVDAYATSKDIRAKYVGRRKDDDEEDEEYRGGRDGENEDDVGDAATKTSSRHAGESLEERKRRQAAEREELLRQMEEEDDGKNLPSDCAVGEDAGRRRKAKPKPAKVSSLFPLSFPETDEYKDLSPMQSLELFEDEVLKDLLSPEEFQSMRQVPA